MLCLHVLTMLLIHIVKTISCGRDELKFLTTQLRGLFVVL